MSEDIEGKVRSHLELVIARAQLALRDLADPGADTVVLLRLVAADATAALEQLYQIRFDETDRRILAHLPALAEAAGMSQAEYVLSAAGPTMRPAWRRVVEEL